MQARLHFPDMAVDTPAFASLSPVLSRLRGGLIVSCQALPDEPLFGSEIMARLAVAARAGGAVGIRSNTPVDVRAIRAVVPDLPLVGLFKVVVPGFDDGSMRFSCSKTE